jgi:hypothetical protein
VRWSGKEISTEDVRQKDWATLQYLHLWFYADQPQEGTVQITLHSQFEDKEGEQDKEGKYPLKEGTFKATLPLPHSGGNGRRAVPVWQECVLHRTRFTPEGDASWLHIVRLSLSRSTKGGKGKEGTEGKEEKIGNLYVGDIVTYTGRTRWTLAGETVVSHCDDAAAWPGATADRVKEEEGALKWLPAETPEIMLGVLPANDWSPYRYLRFWARLPEGKDLPVKVTVHTEKPEDAKDEPRGEEKWTKIGTFSAQITLDQSEWSPYQFSLTQFAKQDEPDWEGVQRVTLSVPPPSPASGGRAGDGGLPDGTVIYLDDLSLYSGRKWYWILAVVAGLMFYTVYSKRYVWFSRLILAVMMGLFAGSAFKGFVTEMFPQISSSFKPLWGNHLSPLDIFNNLVFILTLLCVLMYFFFSFEHKHTVVRGSARMGRWLLMICFGVIFGNTVMGRMSLFIERLMFLLHDWWPHVIGKG